MGTYWVYEGFHFQPYVLTNEVIKDTIINNLQYAKIEENSSGFGNNYIQYFYLRNDTANKKFYAFLNNVDSLIYDFDLSIGDTMISFEPIDISIVDSINLKDYYGIIRKEYREGIPKLIEGIGSLHGLIFYYLNIFFENTRDLKCVKYQGNTLFGDTSSSCNLTLTNPKYDKIEDLKLYPNPANDYIMIDFSSQMQNNYEIKLMDLLGNTLIQSICTEDKTKISLQGLNNQLYILQVKYKDKTQQYKILKQ